MEKALENYDGDVADNVSEKETGFKAQESELKRGWAQTENDPTDKFVVLVCVEGLTSPDVKKSTDQNNASFFTEIVQET